MFPWIERRWSFDSPASLAPALVERLRGTPARLEERLAGVPVDVLVASEPGSWSIQRNAGHLVDLEALLADRLEDFRRGAQELTPWDGVNRATEEADHDARPLSEILERFRRVRAESVARLEAFAPADFERSARHPRLERPMRLVDLCLFHADHDDHHLARIGELLGRGPR